jgi:hypothetical protein
MVIFPFFCIPLRYIESIFGAIQRPLIDISSAQWANLMNTAFEQKLEPPFDPYRDSLHYMVATYVLPYVGLNGYTGANPNLDGYYSKRVCKAVYQANLIRNRFVKGDI